ncbi:MAG: NAD(P)H-hydrate epimerase [Phycisphaerales bacterium]|nr:NAD(P)H-hydrate epimerase [Phycisphaerales bacterium]
MFLTRAQARLIDKIAIEQFHIPGIALMENAARGAADVGLEMLNGKSNPSVLILCGGGNNGGDGLAMARHFHNHGCCVQIGTTVDPARYAGDAAINWRIVQAMQLPQTMATPGLVRATRHDLIVDAIFGTGLDRPPRPPFAALADAVNSAGSPVLAIDLPSGLDCDTGQPLETAMIASRTATFVAPKLGFSQMHARRYTGVVTVVDIGCPLQVIHLACRS